MAGNIDKRNRLSEDVFGYRVTKDSTVFLEWNGKVVKIIKGKDAQKFLARVEHATDHIEIQLIMAKLTGNFKRGNELSC